MGFQQAVGVQVRLQPERPQSAMTITICDSQVHNDLSTIILTKLPDHLDAVDSTDSVVLSRGKLFVNGLHIGRELPIEPIGLVQPFNLILEFTESKLNLVDSIYQTFYDLE